MSSIRGALYPRATDCEVTEQAPSRRTLHWLLTVRLSCPPRKVPCHLSQSSTSFRIFNCGITWRPDSENLTNVSISGSPSTHEKWPLSPALGSLPSITFYQMLTHWARFRGCELVPLFLAHYIRYRTFELVSLLVALRTSYRSCEFLN